MPELKIGQNSYVSREETNEYLDASSRGAPWSRRPGADRDRALISSFRELEKFVWNGTASGVKQASAVVTATPGVGYTVGEELEASGGVGEPLRLRVLSVDAGNPTGFLFLSIGGYTEIPVGQVSFSSTGSGAGYEANVTFIDQSASLPRVGLVDKYGSPLSSLVVPEIVKQSQIELAYEISEDSSILDGAGTGQNIKKVTADTVNVEFFRPTSGPRIPRSAYSLIACLIGSGSGAGDLFGSVATGSTSGESIYKKSLFGRTEGFS